MCLPRRWEKRKQRRDSNSSSWTTNGVLSLLSLCRGHPDLWYCKAVTSKAFRWHRPVTLRKYLRGKLRLSTFCFAKKKKTLSHHEYNIHWYKNGMHLALHCSNKISFCFWVAETSPQVCSRQQWAWDPAVETTQLGRARPEGAGSWPGAELCSSGCSQGAPSLSFEDSCLRAPRPAAFPIPALSYFSAFSTHSPRLAQDCPGGPGGRSSPAISQGMDSIPGLGRPHMPRTAKPVSPKSWGPDTQGPRPKMRGAPVLRSPHIAWCN